MRDIDKEKKDQRRAEVAELKEVRKQQLLQTVLRAKDLNEAAQHLDTTCEELKKRILSYGVIRNYKEVWAIAVKDYMDAGQPHQYEMNIFSGSEFVEKYHQNLETKFEGAILEGEAELTIPDPARPDRTIKYNLPL
jgi:hypothetical protein